MENPEHFDNSLDPHDILPRPPVDEKRFVPSLAQPMPSFQCTQIKKNGERCSRNALAGMSPENAKCTSHGGTAPGVVEAAESRKDAVRLALLQNVDLAIETLESLMQPEVSDAVRLKAATEVLDRTIGKTPIDLNVNETVKVNASEELLKQLQRLAENTDSDDIIDAEVVETDPE